ncbi:aarF domain-containing protein kinase 1 isoform X2 [Epinephelus lanceolatus]|uniref:aarF domain-containing protein kinase 1 isoform X2 n=1 Tax=Epinephelus lanceolatus TaxID=310571 RepID=UPI001445FCC4|nr:aarF domain-containing protein kinase 1 isoform X2 [Epinephelus lanceolatus]
MAGHLLKISSLATAVFATSGFYIYGRQLDLNDLSVIRFGRAAATVHLRSAERLRDLCCANRGTFIKVGQHLGALDYLLPEEYTSTLKVLHSRAPQSSMEEIQQVIREDLGKELSELFVTFEEKPQGAASLAQVHKAVLHDGRTVAIKVQHPKVQRQSSKDIVVMEVLLRVVHWLFPDFAFMWLVEEAKKNMPLELDFLNEGQNAERMANMLAHFPFLKVPMIHWDLSTKRILTMEFVEGGQVNERDYMKKHGINVNEISENLGKMYSEMIFVHGFVHCDPHPGNVLVRKCTQSNKTEIILLDHGLYQVLQPEFRLDYCQLWQALINGDMSAVKRYSLRLGAGDLYPLFACVLTARSWTAINAGISSVPVTHSETAHLASTPSTPLRLLLCSLLICTSARSAGSSGYGLLALSSAAEDVEIRTNAALYLPQISELLNRVPRQMLLLLKTNDLLRGIETTLQTRASSSSFINMSRCCIRAMARHKISKTQSRRRRLQITLAESLSLWRLTMYELFLRVKGSTLGNWLTALLAFLA